MCIGGGPKIGGSGGGVATVYTINRQTGRLEARTLQSGQSLRDAVQGPDVNESDVLKGSAARDPLKLVPPAPDPLGIFGLRLRRPRRSVAELKIGR